MLRRSRLASEHDALYSESTAEPLKTHQNETTVVNTITDGQVRLTDDGSERNE